VSDDPRSDSYDVVVVGTGIGGISAAALLAKAGREVLAVEQAPGVGGYARSFRRDGYRFDPAIHWFGQGQPDALPMAYFDYLGVRDRINFMQVSPGYKAVFPDGREVEAGTDLDSFIEGHQQLFPDEAESIERFFRLCRQLHKDAHELPPQLGLDKLDEAAKRFPVLFKHLRSTVGDVLDEYFEDEQLKGVASVMWPYMGSPPSRLSFVTFATTLSVLLEGAFHCEGGFQAIPDALLEAFEREGGEVVTGRRVTRILVEDGSATGVELEGGRRVRAGSVVSNADATATFEELVGEEHVPASLLKRLRRMKPSLSAVVAFVGTDLDMSERGVHEIFPPHTYDQEQIFQDLQNGRPGGIWGAIPSLIDPSLAPDGHHTLTISAMTPFDIGKPWEGEADRYAEAMIGDFEPIFPGLKDSVKLLETATPETLHRYCLNRGAACYGWENIPSQTGGRRSAHITPIKGLFLSGHWSQPGSGSIRVLVSGLHTAQMVLVMSGGKPADFEHPDVPPLG
jgi:prolycopene isomerase